MFDWTPNVPPIGGAVNVRVGIDCKCIECVAAGWYAAKQLRVDQTIRNVTCGNLEILLVVIGQGVTAL